MASDGILKGAGGVPREPYDVRRAFMRIEDDLIASMMRNLGRHLKEEQDEGFEWSQWQVEQLKYLQEYRRRNREKYGPRFDSINEEIEEAIRYAHQNGQKDEELHILDAISKDKKIRPRYANPSQPSIEAAGDAFFRVNDRKLEALVEAAHNDMQAAEHAVLRRVDDQYRRIIFDAQMYANTGAGTVEKAVDMATKDFLMKGIDSIQYRNGARHTISDYADMYIRTAERRAYLMGEGKKRQEWGEQLVIVNRRGTMKNGNFGHACPLCIPWLGRILIDDVYSGGKPDGKHDLLSNAMAQGFLHPRCRDGFTTYFPGISPQEDPVTKQEAKKAVEAEKRETRLQYAERQQERYERLAEYSLDPENKRVYGARAEQWGYEARKLRNNIPKGYVDERKIGNPISTERLSIFLENAASKGIRIGADPGSTGNFELYCGDPEVLEDILDKIDANMRMAKKAGLMKPDDEIILIYDNVLGYRGDRSAIDVGAFAQTKGKTITLNKFMFDSTEFLIKEYSDAEEHGDFARGTSYKNIVDHEFGHIIDKRNRWLKKRLIDVLKRRAISDKISIEKYIKENISIYANVRVKKEPFTELVAEIVSMKSGDCHTFAEKLLREAGVYL